MTTELDAIPGEAPAGLKFVGRGFGTYCMWNLLGLGKPCLGSENSASIGYRQTLRARGDQPAIPEKLKPLGVSKTDDCEKVTTPLENYRMYHQEGETLQRSKVAGLDSIP